MRCCWNSVFYGWQHQGYPQWGRCPDCSGVRMTYRQIVSQSFTNQTSCITRFVFLVKHKPFWNAQIVCMILSKLANGSFAIDKYTVFLPNWIHHNPIHHSYFLKQFRISWFIGYISHNLVFILFSQYSWSTISGLGFYAILTKLLYNIASRHLMISSSDLLVDPL